MNQFLTRPRFRGEAAGFCFVVSGCLYSRKTIEAPKGFCSFLLISASIYCTGLKSFKDMFVDLYLYDSYKWIKANITYFCER